MLAYILAYNSQQYVILHCYNSMNFIAEFILDCMFINKWFHTANVYDLFSPGAGSGP